jgi:hypothetical protein
LPCRPRACPTRMPRPSPAGSPKAHPNRSSPLLTQGESL